MPYKPPRAIPRMNKSLGTYRQLIGTKTKKRRPAGALLSMARKGRRPQTAKKRAPLAGNVEGATREQKVFIKGHLQGAKQ
jgi:hypothetical protein